MFKKIIAIIFAVMALAGCATQEPVEQSTIDYTSVDGLPLANSAYTSYRDKTVFYGKNPSAQRIDIWYDYLCSHCATLEIETGHGLQEAAEKGDVYLAYHPIHGMHGTYNGLMAQTFLWLAQNAPEYAIPSHLAAFNIFSYPLLTGQNTQEPTIDNIIELERHLGMDKETLDRLRGALSSGDMESDVTLVTNWFFDKGFTGTPTVEIDGVQAQRWDEALAKYATD